MQMTFDRSFKVRELQVRFKATHYKSPATLTSPQRVHEFLRPILKHHPREHLVSLALTSQNQLIGFETVSQGTANASFAQPSEVFKAVLLTNATAFILAHNHPSGNCLPSLEDRQTCERISRAAQLIGVELLDFIIVTEESFYSFAQSDSSALKKGGV